MTEQSYHRRVLKIRAQVRVYSVSVTDEDIIRAALEWRVNTPHEDAPGMTELVRLRSIIEKNLSKNLDMLCVLWLRNKFVQLRKAGRLKP